MGSLIFCVEILEGRWEVLENPLKALLLLLNCCEKNSSSLLNIFSRSAVDDLDIIICNWSQLRSPCMKILAGLKHETRVLFVVRREHGSTLCQLNYLLVGMKTTDDEAPPFNFHSSRKLTFRSLTRHMSTEVAM